MVRIKRTFSPRKVFGGLAIMGGVFGMFFPWLWPLDAAQTVLFLHSLFLWYLPDLWPFTLYFELVERLLGMLKTIALWNVQFDPGVLRLAWHAIQDGMIVGLMFDLTVALQLAIPAALLWTGCRGVQGVWALRRLLRLRGLLRSWLRFRRFREQLRQRFTSPRVEKALAWAERALLPYPASVRHHLPHTGGLMEHSFEVCFKALQVAEGAGLDAEEKELLLVAALLHDAGKSELYVLQGTLCRWEGEGGLWGLARFLLTGREPFKWMRIPGVKDDHPERGARIAAELFEDDDRIFAARLSGIIRSHHEAAKPKDRVLEVLIKADREMTGEEMMELKGAVAESMVGVIRGFTPNAFVEGRVMMVYTPDIPDVLFVNSFMLRDKLVETLEQIGYLVSRRRLYSNVEVMDKIIWETAKELGLRKDLPGVSGRDELVYLALGRKTFKMLPLDVAKIFSPEEVKRFPVYPYEVTLLPAGGAESPGVGNPAGTPRVGPGPRVFRKQISSEPTEGEGRPQLEAESSRSPEDQEAEDVSEAHERNPEGRGGAEKKDPSSTREGKRKAAPRARREPERRKRESEAPRRSGASRRQRGKEGEEEFPLPDEAEIGRWQQEVARAAEEEDYAWELFRRLRWKEGVRCPYCGSDQIRTKGTKKKGARVYNCRECGRRFSDLSGTGLAGLRMSLCKVFQMIMQIHLGRSEGEICRDLHFSGVRRVRQLASRLRSTAELQEVLRTLWPKGEPPHK